MYEIFEHEIHNKGYFQSNSGPRNVTMHYTNASKLAQEHLDKKNLGL